MSKLVNQAREFILIKPTYSTESHVDVVNAVSADAQHLGSKGDMWKSGQNSEILAC